MIAKADRYEDYPNDPQGIDLKKSRKYCKICYIIALVINILMIVDVRFILPFLFSLIMANYYFHRANPKLNFTQKVVVEIVGFSVANLPNLILWYLFFQTVENAVS